MNVSDLTWCSRISRRRPKRGFVLVAVIVIMSVSLTLFGIWAQAAIRARSRLATQQFHSQAMRLAEAGLHRAIVRRATDSKYEGETWSVPADELDKTHAAKVQIRIVINPIAGTTRYEATAEFPAGALRRAQNTKAIDLPNPLPEQP